MSRQGNGYLCVVIGSILSLGAFFLMPCASTSFFSATAAELLNSSNPFIAYFSQNLGLQWLWLEPIIAVTIGILAGYNLPKARATYQTNNRVAVITLALSVTALFVIGALYIHISQALRGGSSTNSGISATSLVGAGFWFLLIGMALAIVGSIVALTAPRPNTLL